MTLPPDNRERAPITYYVLDLWMRLLALLIPEPTRESWSDEWDGELWYGIAANPKARWRAAVGLAIGLLRDALHVRRLESDKRDLRRACWRLACHTPMLSCP